MRRKEEVLNALSGLFIFSLFPTELKALAGGTSDHIAKPTPLQVFHGADKRLLGFVALFFFPSPLLLPQPCERSSGSQRKAEKKGGNKTLGP